MQKKKEKSLHSVANDYLCLQDMKEIIEMLLDTALHIISAALNIERVNDP
jgi:hypothetical protein